MSTKWQAQFHGRGLLRVGRFGIGALASFLLADSVKVTTRHISDDEGLQFSFALNMDNIEVRRVEGVNIGTEIVLESLCDDTVAKLKEAVSSWYVSDQPKVRVYIDNVEVEKFCGNYGRSQQIDSCLKLDVTAVVDERENNPSREDEVATYVNGFRIGRPDRWRDYPETAIWDVLGFNCDLYISDPYHAVPINLTRTKFEHDFLKDEKAMLSLLGILRELWDSGPNIDEWITRAGTDRNLTRWKRGLHMNRFAYYKGALYPATAGFLYQLAGGKVYNIELRRDGTAYSPLEWISFSDAPVRIASPNPGVYSNFPRFSNGPGPEMVAVYGSYPPSSPFGMLYIGQSPVERDGRIAKRKGDPPCPVIPEQLWHRDIVDWTIDYYQVGSMPAKPYTDWWLESFPNGLPIAP